MQVRRASGKCTEVTALRVMFAGGGTGGHLFPAIAIADEVKKLRQDTEILFVGTKDKIEGKVVPQRGYKFQSIWISGFHRRIDIKNLVFPLKVLVSLMQARSIIQSFKPNVVVGTGGYVCGPVVRAAVALKVPTLLQEQNSYPGVTIRMLAYKVDEIHLTFERSKQYLRHPKRVLVSGNPTRSDLELVSREDALKFFGFHSQEQKKTILVFGGSLGARSLNEAMGKYAMRFVQQGFRIIWQTGQEDFQKAKQSADRIPAGQLNVSPFIDRMDYAYAACDLVICRAGATTIAELTRLGKPALLVPYPHAAANHQVENAKALVEGGAAKMINDDELNDKLFSSVLELFEGDRLEKMRKQSKSFGRPDAAKVIAEHVIALAR